jgi:hypothetical protein
VLHVAVLQTTFRFHPYPEDSMSVKNQERKAGKSQSGSLLDEVLERRLMLYALAAGTVVVCAPGAQAKVVFTPNNTVLRADNHIDVDLNNDGKTDFRLIAAKFGTENSYVLDQLGAIGAPGNFVVDVGGTSYKTGWALALTKDAQIGRNAQFRNRGLIMASFSGEYFGYFGNTTSRFVGVRFLINGETHYGWIGFRQVTLTKFRDNVTATLYGWAYETGVNIPIAAGDTGHAAGDGEDAKAVEPTSLELLAAGNVAMTDWRRRRAG